MDILFLPLLGTLLFIIASYSIYLEWKRVSFKNLPWRIIANILLFLSFWALIAPISFPWMEKSIKTGLIGIILSPGYNKNRLNHKPGDILITRDSQIKAQVPESRFLTNFSGIPKIFPRVDQIQIEGYGLNDEDLQDLDHYPIKFHPPSLPDGIIACHWTNLLKSGEVILVKGNLNNPSGENLQVLLMGDGLLQDSFRISKKGLNSFNLTGSPKIRGKNLFEILLIRGKDTLSKDPIPFFVLPQVNLRIGILSSSPNYENRFLKNYLKEQGYTLWSRTTLSRNKESISTVSDKSSPGPFSEKGIDDFDLFISDPTALQNLKSKESSFILNSIIQKGMGLILEVDSSQKTRSGFLTEFSIGKYGYDTSSATPLIFPQTGTKTRKLNSNPFFILKSMNIQSLIQDGSGKTKAGLMLMGRGKVLLSCIDNTYTWALEGNLKDYTYLWSDLISKVSKKASYSAYSWTDNSFPRLGQEITLHTLQDSLPHYPVQNLFSAFEQDSFLPFYWSSSFWADKSGWMDFPGHNPHKEYVYIFSNSDWKSISQIQSFNTTREYLKGGFPKTPNSSKKTPKELDFISKLIFFLTLIASFAYLWVEKKFWSE